jgi:flavin-dependent dehydrogenase
MKKEKVIIIGANIAGLNCALNLDLNKFSVTIIDKSKNPGLKVCAGGVSAKCDDFIPKRYYEKDFDKMVLWIKNDKMTIDRKHRPLHTINRENYIKHLILRCRKKGITIILGHKIKKEDICNNYINLTKKKLNYNILIGADGFDSIVRQKLKLKNKYHYLIEAKTNKKINDMTLIIEPSLRGYFWMFPHKNYSSIGCCTKINQFKKMCKKLDVAYYDIKGGALQYSYNGTRFGNIRLIGEAAGIISKLTGEGIYYAIISGIETAKELNTGKKSKILDKMADKLNKDTLLKGAIIYLVSIILIKFKIGRNIIIKIAERLSVKGT